jgi:hypothetical protein
METISLITHSGAWEIARLIILAGACIALFWASRRYGKLYQYCRDQGLHIESLQAQLHTARRQLAQAQEALNDQEAFARPLE